MAGNIENCIKKICPFCTGCNLLGNRDVVVLGRQKRFAAKFDKFYAVFVRRKQQKVGKLEIVSSILCASISK